MENTVNILIYIFSSIFLIVLINKVLSRYMKLKSKIIRAVSGYIFLVASYIIGYVISIPILNLIINIILIMFMAESYVSKWYIKLFFAVLIEVVMALCDMFTYVLIQEYLDMNEQSNVSMIFLVILLWIIEKITSYIGCDNKDDLPPIKQTVVLLSIPVGSVIILYCLTNLEISNIYTKIIYIMLLIISFMTFFLYEKIQQEIEIKIKNVELQERNLSYKNQMMLLAESEARVRVLRHDLKNHFIVVNALAKKGQTEEIVDYVSDLSKHIEVLKEYVKTGNIYVDSLYNYYIQRAVAANIKVTVDVKIPENLIIPETCLVSVAGNLLLNAIECAQKRSDGYIDIFMQYKKGMLFLKIKNTYDGVIKENTGRFESTKHKSIEPHGIGLESVKRTVAENGGTVEIDYDSNMFEVNVLMYI